jgi:hypothetical protein
MAGEDTAGWVIYDLWSELAGNSMTTEAEESPLLRSVTREQLLKAYRRLGVCSSDLQSVQISESIVFTCSSELCV